KRSAKETEEEIDELKSTYIEMLNEEATIRNDLKHIEERMQGEKTSTVRISEQTSVLKSELKDLQEKRLIQATELSALQEKNEQADTAFRQSEKLYREAEEELSVQQQFMHNAMNKQSEM